MKHIPICFAQRFYTYEPGTWYHVCVITPERPGLCGAYNWLDGKAAYEITPTGPNQPIEKGECLDAVLGQWKGVNEFVQKASRGAVDHYNFYSMVYDPMTTCGCCECIAAMLPQCNGVMTVGRDYTGETPCGMKFTTLAGVMGGGASSPGCVGHSKFKITQRKFILGDGGTIYRGVDGGVSKIESTAPAWENFAHNKNRGQQLS